MYPERQGVLSLRAAAAKGLAALPALLSGHRTSEKTLEFFDSPNGAYKRTDDNARIDRDHRSRLLMRSATATFVFGCSVGGRSLPHGLG
jgi:hypothetical protein